MCLSAHLTSLLTLPELQAGRKATFGAVRKGAAWVGSPQGGRWKDTMFPCLPRW